MDPALAARLLGIGADALLSGQETGPPVPRDGTLLGHLFESLVTDADVQHLPWLKERLGDDLPDAVVLTTGPL